jgi:hypothetical protein
MSNKSIKFNNADLKLKIRVIGDLIFGSLSDKEIDLLTHLIGYSINNSMGISPEVSRQFKEQMNIRQSDFNVTMHRLDKKRAIAKSGKVITLHPIFHNLNEAENLIIRLSLIHI